MPNALDSQLVDTAVKTIQMLSIDGVEKANSGHPGAPMGLASIAFEVFTHALRFDPEQPSWPNRDRFVLSCGHASMLLYSLLHLSGYDLTLDELRSFRQWGSRTPGHPEVHVTPGVETTTGPLGQGIATAVGMAASLKMLAARFPSEPELFDGRVIGIASDGDMMEGISGEASSLAGHLGLDNLIFFYDDNGITIDGKTDLAFTEDVGKRYEAYNWFVQRIDGHDHEAIRAALDAATAEVSRPSLIIAKTHIGKGSPGKQDKSSAHGEPLGAKESAATKAALGWDHEPFHVPSEVRELFAGVAARGKARHAAWKQRRDALLGRGGAEAELYSSLMDVIPPADLLERLCEVIPPGDQATRISGGLVQQAAAALVPALVGGSADLTPSNKTWIKDAGVVQKGAFGGRNFHFGIREHAMGAFANGLALGGAFIPYTATFLVFSDYMRPAIRLAALSHIGSVFVYTHDSLYLGEDGPTHQPVEHLWALRAIPNVHVVRPADSLECAAAWTLAVERRDGPTVLALTRQNVPLLPRPTSFVPRDMLRGAYIVDEAEGSPAAVILATGSEVSVAVDAKRALGERGRAVRVVSVLCWEQFAKEDAAYRDSVLPAGVKRASVELGITGPWRGIVGDGGLALGHDGFGFSAPWQVIREHVGMTGEAVAARLASWL
ncbi:MAG: transketolase [Deltaproteobacteria bacterium]|nr:transketolase [Deltaproteobacteria bacterium]